MVKQLYNTPIPDASSGPISAERAQQLARNPQQDRGQADVRAIASDATGLSLRGQWRFGEFYSSKLARELEELAESSIDAVPFFDTAREYEESGYYTIDQVNVDPFHPNRPDFWQYDGILTQVGTKETHFRAARVNPTTVSSPFATQTDKAGFGIDTRARKVRWLDLSTGDQQLVTASDVVATRSAEFADLDIVNVPDAPIDADVIVYELDFGDEGEADVRLWDDRDKSKTVSGQPNRWQHVYDSGHEFEGVPVLDNGLLRLYLDESNGLSAEEWDGSSWTSVSLGTSDWELLDFDITVIDTTRVDAQLLLEDTSTTGVIDAVNVSLQRGIDSLLVVVPPSESSMPQGIQDLFSPIASDQDTDPQPTSDVIDREEVRR